MAQTKPAEPVSAALAAQQTDWHVRQAAEYYAESQSGRVAARTRDSARRKFFENSRVALGAIGLEAFIDRFSALLSGRAISSTYNERAALIREIWAEMLVKATGGQAAPAVVLPAACGDAVQVALTNAHRLFTVGQQFVETALKQIGDAKTAEGGAK